MRMDKGRIPMPTRRNLSPTPAANTASNAVATPDLHQGIRQLLLSARAQVRQAVNSAMVQTYWHIGRMIVEDEQAGQARAQYGARVLTELGQRLSEEFGKGFDASNLRNMRQFYTTFPIRDAVRHELSWTHYRSLIRIENPKARDWYAREAAEQGWSVRALDRQIATLYYERLLSTQDAGKAGVKGEAAQLIAAQAAPDPRDFIHFINIYTSSCPSPYTP